MDASAREKRRKNLEKMEKLVKILRYPPEPVEGDDPLARCVFKKVLGFPVDAEKLLDGEPLGVGDAHLKLRRPAP